jgi:hypothetical protein
MVRTVGGPAQCSLLDRFRKSGIFRQETTRFLQAVPANTAKTIYNKSGTCSTPGEKALTHPNAPRDSKDYCLEEFGLTSPSSPDFLWNQKFRSNQQFGSLISNLESSQIESTNSK